MGVVVLVVSALPVMNAARHCALAFRTAAGSSAEEAAAASIAVFAHWGLTATTSVFAHDVCIPNRSRLGPPDDGEGGAGC